MYYILGLTRCSLAAFLNHKLKGGGGGGGGGPIHPEWTSEVVWGCPGGGGRGEGGGQKRHPAQDETRLNTIKML